MPRAKQWHCRREMTVGGRISIKEKKYSYLDFTILKHFSAKEVEKRVQAALTAICHKKAQRTQKCRI